MLRLSRTRVTFLRLISFKPITNQKPQREQFLNFSYLHQNRDTYLLKIYQFRVTLAKFGITVILRNMSKKRLVAFRVREDIYNKCQHKRIDDGISNFSALVVKLLIEYSNWEKPERKKYQWKD